MKTTIELDDSVFSEVEACAHQEGKSVNTVLAETIAGKFARAPKTQMPGLMSVFGTADHEAVAEVQGIIEKEFSKPARAKPCCDESIPESAHKQLTPLIGLRLSTSYRAADMRMFHFGRLRTVERGAVGEYALHVQCPWRIETSDRIITGRSDLFEPAEVIENFDWGSWNWDGNETLQDRLISDLLTNTDLTVQALATDRHGGATLELSAGCALVLFPAGSQGEDWRIFQPNSDGHHFVVSGGRVEHDEA